MVKKCIVLVSTLLFLMASGCGQNLPFEYQYLSANVIQIKYLNSLYTLNKRGPRVNTPFKYRFEPDGDIDITIAGKTYDIDSPYDIDKPKVNKKKASSQKKKNTKKSNKKTSTNKKKTSTNKKKTSTNKKKTSTNKKKI